MSTHSTILDSIFVEERVSMARPRKNMSQLRDILRLTMQLGLSGNQAEQSLSISRMKVQKCIQRAKAASLRWSDISEMSDEALETLLFPPPPVKENKAAGIDWVNVHKELKRKSVTKRLLWEEHFPEEVSGLSYSQFCRRYKAWLAERNLSMRQEHKAGEKLFVDFAGHTILITDRETGEVTKAEIFVATFGASNYTFFRAVASQQIPDWLAVHIQALRFFGGVPKFVVPDNLKSAVTDAGRWERILSRSYQRLAEHYDFGILPARSRRPKDKAKVEKGVQHVEYRALAKLRDFRFFSIEELNHQLDRLRDQLNDEPFQKLPGSRRSWFESVDRPALKPLPSHDFETEEWQLAVRVPKDYHVDLLGHYYSVPFKFVGVKVDIRYTMHTVEVMYKNTRIASHMRNWAVGTKSTANEHLAPSHALYHGLSPDWFLSQAECIGPNTRLVIEGLLKDKPLPQLNFDQCFGVVKSLKSKYGNDELELACGHAVRLNTIGYRVIRSILETGVHSLPEQLILRLGNIQHTNIRGPEYYS